MEGYGNLEYPPLEVRRLFSYSLAEAVHIMAIKMTGKMESSIILVKVKMETWSSRKVIEQFVTMSDWVKTYYFLKLKEKESP